MNANSDTQSIKVHLCPSDLLADNVVKSCSRFNEPQQSHVSSELSLATIAAASAEILGSTCLRPHFRPLSTRCAKGAEVVQVMSRSRVDPQEAVAIVAVVREGTMSYCRAAELYSVSVGSVVEG